MSEKIFLFPGVTKIQEDAKSVPLTYLEAAAIRAVLMGDRDDHFELIEEEDAGSATP